MTFFNFKGDVMRRDEKKGRVCLGCEVVLGWLDE
jgi:hypothetical protein